MGPSAAIAGRGHACHGAPTPTYLVAEGHILLADDQPAHSLLPVAAGELVAQLRPAGVTQQRLHLMAPWDHVGWEEAAAMQQPKGERQSHHVRDIRATAQHSTAQHSVWAERRGEALLAGW